MTDAIRIEVDPGKLFDRAFTELEQKNIPFAMKQAVNNLAWEIRFQWQRQAKRVFDRPTPMTINSVQYRKAGSGGGATRNYGGGIGDVQAHPGTGGLFAEIYIRDQAHKGTPPAKYLFPEVFGGERRPKGFERLLQAKGILPADQFAVPGRGAELDAFGNIKASEINRLLSQLGARSDKYTNESLASRKRRHKREVKLGIRRSDYFVMREKRGSLRPGIWQRDLTPSGTESGVWLVLAFVDHARYRARYDIMGYAQRAWNDNIKFFFERELEKAVASSKFGRGA